MSKEPGLKGKDKDTTASGWIGNGTIPAVDYASLSKPSPLTGNSNNKNNNITHHAPSNADDHHRHQRRRRPRSSSPAKAVREQSRGSSPEKRMQMLTTLRSGKNNNTKNRKDSSSASSMTLEVRPAAASKAAGLAWDHLYGSPVSGNRHAPSPHPGDRRIDAGQAEDSKGNNRRRGRVLDVNYSTADAQPLPQTTTASYSPQISSDTARHPAAWRPSSGSKAQSLPAAVPPIPSPRTRRRLHPDPPMGGGGEAGGDGGVDSAVDDHLAEHVSRKISISPGNKDMSRGPRRKKVTPPSSDQEDSSDNKSIDEDKDGGGDGNSNDEEYALTNVLKKLPRGVDLASARQILNDVVVVGDEVHWDDIAGLEGAKKALKEAVVYPFLRPDLFSGLREPTRGMLLFGPPGTGKTMLARAVATESKSTFFSVSSATLTSKWHGDSEKLVRALFGLAKALAPSIIFVDEIDSLLSSRSSGTENEASRRSKTEFLIQWSDLQRAAAGRERKGGGGDASRVLVLAATNMPWDIDEAARRRFIRRQYIPLPEDVVREEQLRKLLSYQNYELTEDNIHHLVRATDGMLRVSLSFNSPLANGRSGFSGSDMTALAKDAAMGPLRNLGEALLHTPKELIRPIRAQDFEASLRSIRPSVSREGLKEYEDWAAKFGERGG